MRDERPEPTVWIGWNDKDPDKTTHLAHTVALRRSGSPWWASLSRALTRRIWMKWPALCGESLHTLTVGDLIEDVTCVDCEVTRIKQRYGIVKK